MKKTYLIPETSINIVGFQLMQLTSMSVTSGTTGEKGITGGEAKSRDEEEEEAALILSGENETSYGSLW